MKKPVRTIAVIGGSDASESDCNLAQKTGRLIAEEELILLSGGGGGVMEASCRGARSAGGLTIGILAGKDGNAWLDVEIKTAMGHARNVILIQSADAVIAIGGEYGTLSEIAIALKTKIPVFGINSWNIPGMISCHSPEIALEKILCIS